MENKEVKKANKGIKLSMWLSLIVAIMSVGSIVIVLITKETTVATHIMKDLLIIMDSLAWAYVFSKVTVTPIEDKEDKEQE